MKTLVCLFLFTLSAHCEESARPKEMTFSYVEHPTMVNYLIPLIESTYSKLGIKIRFVPQPSNRNLSLLEGSVIDGDVGYLLSELTELDNIFIIEQPVTSAFYTLLCQAEVPCSEAVLADEKHILVSTVASKNAFLSQYKGTLKSQFYTVNNISLIPNFIIEKRFEYALYPTTLNELWRLKAADYQYIKLLEFNLYHVLNNKYAFMAADIRQALQQSQNEMLAK